MSRWDFYVECFNRAFRGRLFLAESISGLLALVMIPVGLEFPEIFRIFGASSWLPLYIFATAFVLIAMYGIIRAPADMHLESVAEIGALRLIIEDRSRIQAGLNELWQLRKTGVALRNTTITAEVYDQWVNDFSAWHAEVIASAKKISANLAQWLEVLDQVTQTKVVTAISNEHAHQLRIFSEILFRMQKFLEKDLRWPNQSE